MVKKMSHSYLETNFMSIKLLYMHNFSLLILRRNLGEPLNNQFFPFLLQVRSDEFKSTKEPVGLFSSR